MKMMMMIIIIILNILAFWTKFEITSNNKLGSKTEHWTTEEETEGPTAL